ncbi:NAD(P)H-hydrate dehydratase [Nanoarchaeota archaeon]
MLTEDILHMRPRPNSSHKGEHGKALLISGSEEYGGAPVLTATACEAVLRSGADLAVACCPEKIAWLVNSAIPEAITKKYPGKFFDEKHADEIIDFSNSFDVLLIGPGLSREAIPFARKVIDNASIPKVIDADAIYAADLRNLSNAVITPHAKEFEVLLSNSDLTTDNFREHLGSNVILLKCNVDRIISKDKEEENKTGNPVMTKGGTGDVLAGLCAGFIAQGNDLFKSACMAAYLNGAVGDLLEKELGRTFLASDIVKNLHRVLN